jgi:hypothetical protein
MIKGLITSVFYLGLRKIESDFERRERSGEDEEFAHFLRTG